MSFAGETRFLHRFIVEVRIGRELNAGEQVNHTCHRPGCINPEHLYIGDQLENIRDMVVAGRARSGRTKLTAEQVRQIRRRYAAGEESHRTLGREYGVDRSTVRAVVSGRSWPRE